MNAAVAAVREEEALLGFYPHIVTVQGTRDYGRFLDHYVSYPITAGGGKNVVYETHPCECRGLGQGMFACARRSRPGSGQQQRCCVRCECWQREEKH